MPAIPHPDDTIAALASAPGGAARGIVRFSGPEVVGILRGWFVSAAPAGQDKPAPPGEKSASAVKSPTSPDSGKALSASAGRPLSRLAAPALPPSSERGAADPLSRKTASCAAGEVAVAGLRRPVPVDLYLWPTRRSYTGQPLGELHAPGSPPILEALLAELFSRGARPAQPGEFTLRAFLAGRLDLVQAEAVLGVIDAHDQRELQQALDQLGGGVSSQVVRLRGDLLDLVADLEAGLDFADEDIEFIPYPVVAGRIGLARAALEELSQRAEGRLRSTGRPRVVLAGPPNAGKSTLFNALVGAAAAIVSPERGTTRDYLAADVTLGGIAITLIDTAGAECPTDAITVAAQERRRDQQAQADLCIRCHPPEEPAVAAGHFPEDRTLFVRTKCDLEGTLPAGFPGALAISAKTGAGLHELARAIAARLAESAATEGTLLGMTSARCRECLIGAGEALDRALEIARRGGDRELLAVDLRDALEELGKIVGAVCTDDILDRIFSRFCIGK